MDATEDFYFEVLRQLKMDRWSNGRVILTGDAAWCAKPLSGIGTTLAIVGGYVLANELAAAPTLASALSRYAQILRPIVKEGQGVPKIVPRLLWPHSRAEISVLHGTLRLAATPALRKLFAAALVRDAEEVRLPDYAAAGGGAAPRPSDRATTRRLQGASYCSRRSPFWVWHGPGGGGRHRADAAAGSVCSYRRAVMRRHASAGRADRR